MDQKMLQVARLQDSESCHSLAFWRSVETLKYQGGKCPASHVLFSIAGEARFNGYDAHKLSDESRGNMWRTMTACVTSRPRKPNASLNSLSTEKDVPQPSET